MEAGGITRRLVDFSNLLVGHLKGGLAHTNIVASMLMAGISGAGVADAAAIGALLIPSMKKEGYSPEFSAAVVAAASVSGPIIPPSITMVVYASIVGVSVGGLFLAGIIPGVLLCLSLMVLVFFMARRHNYVWRSERSTFREMIRGFLTAALALVMPVIIIGGIVGGIFTATEAAAVAVAYAFMIGVFIYKKIPLKSLRKHLIAAGRTSGSILFIIACANILAWVLASQQIPQTLSEYMLSLSTDPYFLLFLVNVFLLAVGMFLETGAAVILLSPILHPALTGLGLHPLHVGLVFVLNLSIGLITPPVGICLFVTCSIAGISLEKLAKTIVPFLLVEFAVLFLVSFFPGLVLCIPKLFGFA
jgi:tripartite ATP-independent transporter DctM subunit